MYTRQPGDEERGAPERLKYRHKPANPFHLAYFVKRETPLILDASYVGTTSGMVDYDDEDFYTHYRRVHMQDYLQTVTERNPEMADDENFVTRIACVTGTDTHAAGIASVRKTIRDNPSWFTPNQRLVQENMRQHCELWSQVYPTVPDVDTDEEDEEDEEDFNAVPN